MADIAPVQIELPVHPPSLAVERLNILVFGNPGTGKTTLGGTAEDDERSNPVLFVDLEGGTSSISYRKVDVFEIRDFKVDMNKLDVYLDAHAHDLPYKTIVLDSLTELSNQVMERVKVRQGRKTNDTTPQWDDWDAWSNRMRTALGKFRNLPVNLIMTALEDADEEHNIFRPLFPGKKVSQALPGYFNTVARAEVRPKATGGEDYYLTMQSNGRARVRDRVPTKELPREIKDPTVTKLLDRMVEAHRIASLARAKQEQATATKGKAQ